MRKKDQSNNSSKFWNPSRQHMMRLTKMICVVGEMVIRLPCAYSVIDAGLGNPSDLTNPLVVQKPLGTVNWSFGLLFWAFFPNNKGSLSRSFVRRRLAGPRSHDYITEISLGRSFVAASVPIMIQPDRELGDRFKVTLCYRGRSAQSLSHPELVIHSCLDKCGSPVARAFSLWRISSFYISTSTTTKASERSPTIPRLNLDIHTST